MGSGGSKGSAVEVGPAERRGRMRGLSCLCFSSSSDQEKVVFYFLFLPFYVY